MTNVFDQLWADPATRWLREQYAEFEQRECRELDNFDTINVRVTPENKNIVDFLHRHGVATGDTSIGAVVSIEYIRDVTASWFSRKTNSRAHSM